MTVLSKQRAVFHAPNVKMDESAAHRVGVPAGDHGGPPQIEVIRDGDVVCAIDVKCSCGERIRILCDYQ